MTVEERKIVDKWLDQSILTIAGKRISSVDDYEQMLANMRQRSKRMIASGGVWEKYMNRDTCLVGGVQGYKVERAARILTPADSQNMETWNNEEFQFYLKLLDDLCRFLCGRTSAPAVEGVDEDAAESTVQHSNG